MANKTVTSAPAAASGDSGACVVTDQISGVQTTLFLTQAECTARGGQFIGGPVGPAFAAAPVKPQEPATKKPAAKKNKKSPPPKKTAAKKVKKTPAPKKKIPAPKKKGGKK
jgi:hypothetical protein